MLLADSIFQFFTGVNILGFEIIRDRVSSFFNDELILGSYLVRLLTIILWFMFFFLKSMIPAHQVVMTHTTTHHIFLII